MCTKPGVREGWDAGPGRALRRFGRVDSRKPPECVVLAGRTKRTKGGDDTVEGMSATPANTTGDLSEKQRRILKYLEEHAETKTYFKSRLIGQELGLTAKEVGTNMTAIADGEFSVEVERWGYSSSTTWQVTA